MVLIFCVDRTLTSQISVRSTFTLGSQKSGARANPNPARRCPLRTRKRDLSLTRTYARTPFRAARNGEHRGGGSLCSRSLDDSRLDHAPRGATAPTAPRRFPRLPVWER